MATITTNRTSGIAPLLIIFDNDYSTYDDFRHNMYEWNFDDSLSGIWIDGKPKNTEKGPISAHVFETAGIYTVTLTVKDENGIIETDTIDITVTDPDTFYSGTNTICVNPAGDSDFTNAPSGSYHISTDDLTDLPPLITGNDFRVLLKRGETWSITEDISWPNYDNITIGAYGSGDRPQLDMNPNTSFANIEDKSDWKIMDISLEGQSALATEYWGPFGGNIDLHYHLFFRVKTVGFGVAIAWGHYNDSTPELLHSMGVIECEAYNAYAQCSYVGGENIAIMGNNFYDTVESHVLRVWQAYKSVISHNRLSGSSMTYAEGRHALKLHGPGVRFINGEWQIEYADGELTPNSGVLAHYTEYVVVSDNIFGSSGPWPLSIGPQDTITDTTLSYIIFERNRIIGEYNPTSQNLVQIAMHMEAQHSIIRNNILDGTGSSNDYSGIVLGYEGSIGGNAHDIEVYNNTIFHGDNSYGNYRYGIRTASNATDNIIRNNLINFYIGNVPGVPRYLLEDLGTGTISSNNLFDTAVNFIDYDNVDPLLRDFRMTANATDAINQGYTIPSVLEDFNGDIRPLEASYDIGAFEYNPVYIIPRRTSGVAPLLIQVEANFATDDNGDEFRHYTYLWDFGDSSSGTWYNGKSKNTEYLGISAHLYETPGNYTITLTVYDDTKTLIGINTQEIIVSDPDIIFPTTQTICVNNASDSDFTNAPSGCIQLQTDDLATVATYVVQDRRILFKRGGSWNNSTDVSWPNVTNVLIGAYGTGTNPDIQGHYDNDPILNKTGGESLFVISQKQYWTFDHIRFNSALTTTYPVSGATNMQNFLMSNCHVTGFLSCIGWSHWTDSQLMPIQDMSLVNCFAGDTEQYPYYLGAEYLTMIGCIGQNSNVTHVSRIWQAYHSVIAHCRMSGSSLSNSNGRHAMKLHSPSEAGYEIEYGPLEAYTGYLRNRSEYIAFHNNEFGSSGYWPLSIGPQDNIHDERVSKIVVEGCRLVPEFGEQSSTLVNVAMHFQCQYGTIRNTLFDGNGSGSDYTAVEITQRGIEPPPTEDEVYNCTIRNNTVTNGDAIGITVGSTAVDTTIRNLIVEFPNASNPTGIYNLGTNTVSSNNLLNATNVEFIDPDNVDPLSRSFKLTANATDAINQGYELPSVYFDFDGNDRPLGVSYDIGAFEYNPVYAMANRTSGVAPLLVHFECNYTSDDFIHKEYSWNFDDPNSGNWSTTNKSKNTAKGAISAHVFETPGVYTVTLTVKDETGIIGTDTIDITVTDPDTFYSGTNTICVNPAGDSDFTNAPSGSVQLSTDNLDTLMSYVNEDTRILFKRGESWTLTSELSWPQVSGVTIGAYGSGDKPEFTLSSGTEISFLPMINKQDWRIMDMSFLDPAQLHYVISGVVGIQRNLFLRLDADGFYNIIGWGHWNDSQLLTIEENFIVDCNCSNMLEYAYYFGGERCGLLGCVGANSSTTHVARMWQAFHGVIENNILSGSSLDNSNGRHALKLTGPGNSVEMEVYEHGTPTPGTGLLENYSEYIVVSDNIFGSSGPWPVSVGASDNWSDAQLNYILFERNRFSCEYGEDSSTLVQLSLHFTGRYSIIKNNIFDGYGSANDYTAIGIGVGENIAAPPADNNEVYNNTIYKSDNIIGNGRVGIETQPEVSNNIIRNNLVLFPNATVSIHDVVDNGTNTISSNNLLNGTVYLSDPDNTDPLLRDFSLLNTSTDAINQGYTVSSVLEDFNEGIRPLEGSYDIGAFEYNSGTFETYSITYYGNGNTSGNPPTTGNYEENASVIIEDQGTLLRTYYTFTGWNTNILGTGTHYDPDDTFNMPANDINLYAEWELSEGYYTVTYNSNYATSGSIPVDSNFYTSSDPVSILNNTGNLLRTDYIFKGWYLTSGSGYIYSPGEIINISNSITLYAKWAYALNYVNPDVINSGLTKLTTDGNTFVICNTYPTNYIEASSTYALGISTITISSPAIFSMRGRKVSTSIISNEEFIASGSTNYWAILDSVNEVILAIGKFRQEKVVAEHDIFNMNSMEIEIL